MPTFEELFPEYAGAPPARPFEPIIPGRVQGGVNRAQRMAINVGAQSDPAKDLDELMAGYKPRQPAGATEWKDYGKSFIAGTGGLGEAAAGAGEYVSNLFAGDNQSATEKTFTGLADVFGRGRRSARAFQQDWFQSMTPEAQSRAVREMTTLDPNKTIWQGGPGEFLSSVGLKMSNAAPSTLVTLLPGGLIMRAGLGPGAITYLGASEGALSMGSIAANIADEIEQAPEAELMQSERYAALRQSMGDQEARQALIREAQGYAPVIGGLVVGAISAAAGRYLEPVFEGGKTMTQRFVRGAIAEGPFQEAPQSFAEQVAQNVAAQTFDQNRGTFEGAGEQAVQGGAIGAGMGGGFSMLAGRGPEPVAAPPPAQDATIPEQGPPPAQPFQQVFTEQTPPAGGWRGGDVEFGDYDQTPLTRTDAEGNVIQQPAARGFNLTRGVDPAITAAMRAKQADMFDEQQGPSAGTPQQYMQRPWPVTQQEMDLPQPNTAVANVPTQQNLPLSERVRGVGRVPVQPMAAQPMEQDLSLPNAAASNPEMQRREEEASRLRRGATTRNDFIPESMRPLDLRAGTALDPRQQDMFPPEGPQQMPDEPSAEPIGDLNAQIEDLVDPDSPRLGVYLSPANMQQVGDIPAVGVPLANFDGKGGTLIAKNRQVAEQLLALRDEGGDMQQVLGLATGAGVGKPAGANIAVQQRDERGNVVQESLVATPEEAEALAASFDTPGHEGVILSAGQAIRRRGERIALEQQIAQERKAGSLARRRVEEEGGGERARDVAERLTVLRGRLAAAEKASEEGPTRSARLKAAEAAKKITRDIEQLTAHAAKAARRVMPERPDLRKKLEETSEEEIARLSDEQVDELFKEAIHYSTGLQGRVGGMAGGKMFGGDTSTPQALTKALSKRAVDSPELTRLKEILNVIVPAIQSRIDKKGQSDKLRQIWLNRLNALAEEVMGLREKLDKVKPRKDIKMFPDTAEKAEAETRAFMRKTLPDEMGTRDTAEMGATTSLTPTGQTAEQIEKAHGERSEKLKYIARAKRKMRERAAGKKVKTKPITATGKVEEKQTIPERLQNAIRLTKAKISMIMREEESSPDRDAEIAKLNRRLRKLEKKALTKRETEYIATRKGELTPSRAFDLEPPREMSKAERAKHNARVRTTYSQLDKTMLKFAARLEKANDELAQEAQKRETGGNPPHNARNAIYGRAYFNELFRYGQLLGALRPRSKRGLREVEKFNALLDKLLSAKGDKFLSTLADAMQAESATQARTTFKLDPKEFKGLSTRRQRRATLAEANKDLATKISNAKRLHDVWHKEPLFNDVVGPMMQKLIGYMTHDTSPGGFLPAERRGLGYTPTFAEMRRLRAALKEFQQTNYDKLYQPLRDWFEDYGYKFDEQGDLSLAYKRTPEGQYVESEKASQFDYTQPTTVLERIRNANFRNPVLNYKQKMARARIEAAVKEARPEKKSWTFKERRMWAKWRKGRLSTESLQHYLVFGREQGALVEERARRMNLTPKQQRKEDFKLMMNVEKDRRSNMSYEQRKALEALDRNQTPFFLKELAVNNSDYIEHLRTAGESVAARLEDMDAVTTGDQVLHILAFNLPESHPYRQLIDKLTSLNMNDVRVAWDTDKGVTDSFGTYRQVVNEAGRPMRRITFNRAKFESHRELGTDPASAFVHSILHEMTHAATIGAIKNNPRVKAALWAIMRNARIAAEEQGVDLKTQFNEHGKAIEHYGFRGNLVEEFVAEAFTNQGFQNLLRQIEFEPKRSVWQVILDLVKRLLGMADTPQADNVLDAVLATTDHVFTGELAQSTRGASATHNIDDLSVRQHISNYIDKAMQSTRVTRDIRERAKNTFEANKEGGSRFMLSALTMEQIRDFYYKSFGGAKGALHRYMKAFFQRNADNSANMEEADRLSRRWTKLTEEHMTDEDNPSTELSRIMTEATLYGMHPDESINSKQNESVKSLRQRERHADLVKRFKALPPEFRQLYADLKSYYSDTFRKEVNLVTLNALRAVLGEPFNYTEEDVERKKLNTIDGLKKEFGDQLTEGNYKTISRIARLPMEHVGPYFPLMRFGEYVVSAERVVESKTFDDRKDATAWGNEQRESDPTLDVSSAVPNENGSFTVTVKEKEVRMAETPSEAEQNRQDMIAEYGAENVDREIQRKSNLHTAKTAIGSGSGLRSILSKLNGNPAAQSAIKDFYLRSISDRAFRKREIKRANRRGVDYELQHRTFGSYAKAAAYYMSQLRYGSEMADALIDMDRFAKNVAAGDETSDIPAVRLNDVVDEINTRDKLTHDPIEVSKLVRGSTEVSQFMMLTSPSYWLINLTQPYMVTLPWLSARSSVGDATAALLKAQNLIKSPILEQMGQSAGGLKALWSKTSAEEAFSVLEQVENRIKKHGGARADEYISMLNKLKRDSIIDLSFVAELRDIAEGQSTTAWQKVLDASRIMSHLTEVNNRIMSAIAAYDIARNRGNTPEEAQGFAKKAVSLTQFNYSAGNAPRLFQARGPLGQMGPLVFQFMKYPQHMYALLIDSMRTAVKQGGLPRKEALKTLMGLFTTHLAAGGILGATLQPVKWAIGLALMAFGDDDEPYTFQNALSNESYDRWMREMTADLMGTDMGEIVSGGLPRAAGVDLSNRMSLGTLYMMDLNPKTAETLMGSLVQTFGGPAVNLLGNFYGGAQQMAEGQVMKGMESFLPKAAKDALRTFRYSNQGLTDATGKEIMGADQMGPGELFAQSMGFQPSQISEKYAARSAINDKKAYDNDRHDSLMRRFQNADAEDRPEIIREIAEFNRTTPGARITRSQLLKSTRRFQGREMLSRRYGTVLEGDDRVYAQEGDIYNDE